MIWGNYIGTRLKWIGVGMSVEGMQLMWRLNSSKGPAGDEFVDLYAKA